MEENTYRRRAEEIVKKLTLDEKIGMVHGAELFRTKGVERLGIPPLVMSDGPMGVRQDFEAASWRPIGTSADQVSYLPCNSALAATWNRKLAYDVGAVLGEETRGRGKDVILGPGVNIKRSPLCGRNFEYFSEDPYLTKELVVPFIRGIQNWDVAACVKHFAANNQETERLWVDVEVDEKALREIYLPAFHDAVKEAGSYTIMTAYNKLNGEHCYCHEGLLAHILRKEWDYDGVVISDWGGVHDTALAAKSQLDIEMSVTDNFDAYYMAEPLKKKIEAGEIDEYVLDEKVVHILMLMFRLHMIGDASQNGRKRKRGSFNTPEHREKALAAARESVILLKNESKRLPLNADEMQRLLVIGENADCIHALGGGSAEIKALYEITPLMGICSFLGGNTEVKFTQGYVRDEKQEETDTNWQETSLEDGGGKTRRHHTDEEMRKKREKLRKEAVALAARYDDVIFVGGLNHLHDSEGNDRADMKLPYEQDILIRELLETNPKTVIVLMGGSPVEMGEWIEGADTVVWNWYSGMEGGRALAEVLFGAVNPSGKLPETFYKKHTDCSAHAIGEFPGGKKVRYKEGVYVGYRYNDTFDIEPQFCFGHGLSYTKFEYSDPSIQEENGKCLITCKVRNIGGREGKETVQVYYASVDRSADRPAQELKGFEKISLKAGEEKIVNIQAESCPKGTEVRIGSSSRDIRARIEFTGR